MADNGFFKAQHTVNLHGGKEQVEIKTQGELEAIITQEKEAILTDKELRKSFDKVQKSLEKNAELRDFCRYLQENEAVLSRMDNMELFKEDVLKSYLKVHERLFADLLQTLDAVDARRRKIEAEAKEQTTQWDEVIRIFNERFFVPFQLVAKNRMAVILGEEQIPILGFTYKQGGDSKDIEKSILLQALSTGERKALYILNVIFEIERRKRSGADTLIILNDIADSSDYNNKYAIIHYLKEISEDGIFKMIIMTHNFDFFRTINSRFVPYRNCLMATKNEEGISLVQAAGIRNVFANDWKKAFFTNSRKKIASIPFLRNLIEMTTGEDDPHFKKLTAMLHWKTETPLICVKDLDHIFNVLCQANGTSTNEDEKISSLIIQEAENCVHSSGGLNLENKIVLAIGIRIVSEQYMIKEVNDSGFVEGILANQTQALTDRFKQDFTSRRAELQILDRVALMTPENIHVNSFMYEPILDMSDDHLRALFTDVKRLR